MIVKKEIMMDKTLLTFGQRFKVAILVPNSIIVQAEKGYFNLFEYLEPELFNEVKREFDMPNDSAIKWTGYKYLEKLNIHSFSIEATGIIIER